MNTGASFAERRAMFSNSNTTPSGKSQKTTTLTTTTTKTSFGTVNGESKLAPVKVNGSQSASARTLPSSHSVVTSQTRKQSSGDPFETRSSTLEKRSPEIPGTYMFI